MKMMHWLAAASIAFGAVGVSVAADAQPPRHEDRADRGGRDGPRDYRGRDDRRHHARPHHGRRPQCRTVRRHGHRQRICR